MIHPNNHTWSTRCLSILALLVGLIVGASWSRRTGSYLGYAAGFADELGAATWMVICAVRRRA